jgi:xylan 1,4-beta-xylosidase
MRPFLLALLLFPSALLAAETSVLVDPAKSLGSIKPLNGVNHGPLIRGENAPLDSYHAAAGFPFTRLHDCHWPSPDVVDISCIFPLFGADADDPANYLFAKTDDYLAAIVHNKSQIVYRLGQSIEPWTKYYNHPPADFDKWTSICLHIIRHYNEGWDHGFHYGIKYWEIWNETEFPDMWTGTQEQYFDLYKTAATAIKAHDPSLKVGGPAATHIQSKRVEPFLAFCREQKLPLDFFSWHAYHGDPQALVDDAAAARRLLDQYGFAKTESHMNEWRYLPTWSGLRPKNLAQYENGAVREWFAGSCRAEGASFCATVLLRLQDSPVDVANFYSADTSPWSMFDQFGVPSKVYYAFKAFHLLAQLSNRVSSAATPANGLASCAAVSDDRRTIGVLVSNFSADAMHLSIAFATPPAAGSLHIEIFQVDATHNLDKTEDREGAAADSIRLEFPSYGVCFVQIKTP